MENILSDAVDYAFRKNLSTDQTTLRFEKKLANMSNDNFIRLLEISGYIPDIYLPDSAEETLYSKLIEQLVCQWALRIGFNKSYLQTQKSSVEDITITDGTDVIVCDAKSFRLGRSQAAPNVKDVIKQGDYKKWSNKYQGSGKGGIVTFPSKFEWKVSSDIHSYLTDNSNPILYLYYQHLSAMLKFNMNKTIILSFFDNHNVYFPKIIPKSDDPKSRYFSVLEKHFFGSRMTDYTKYMRQVDSKIKILKDLSIQRLNDEIDSIERKVESEIQNFKTIDELKEFSSQMLKEERTKEFLRIKKNIEKFR